MSLKPIDRAWVRPRSTRRSFTQRSRSRSTVRAVAAVPAQVDLDHGQLLLDQRREGLLSQLLLEWLEGGAGEHLLLQPLGGRPALAGADGKADLGDVRHGPEQLFNDRLAEEARGPGDQDRLPGDAFGNQGLQF